VYKLPSLFVYPLSLPENRAIAIEIWIISTELSKSAQIGLNAAPLLKCFDPVGEVPLITSVSKENWPVKKYDGSSNDSHHITVHSSVINRAASQLDETILLLFTRVKYLLHTTNCITAGNATFSSNQQKWCLEAYHVKCQKHSCNSVTYGRFNIHRLGRGCQTHDHAVWWHKYTSGNPTSTDN